MKKLLIVFWVLWLLFLCYIQYRRDIREYENEIFNLKQKQHNDSLLLEEYQKTMMIVTKRDSAMAEEFYSIMDSINRYESNENE
jgi:hypothetical protein